MTSDSPQLDAVLLQANQQIKESQELIARLREMNTSIQHTIVSTRAELKDSYDCLHSKRTPDRSGGS